MLVSRAKGGQTVHMKYVKGHSGNEGNDGADRLAVEGCRQPPLAERDWDAERDILENPPPEDVIDWEVRRFLRFFVFCSPTFSQEYADGILDDESFMAEVQNL
jgi:hypothetical protein